MIDAETELVESPTGPRGSDPCVSFSLSVPVSLVSGLQDRARQEGTSVRQLARQALERFLCPQAEDPSAGDPSP